MTLSTGLDARELRLRASLLAHYELHWLGVEDEDGVLFPDSRRVRVESGMRHWCLDDSVRRSTVAGVELSELRRVWSQLRERPGDARQWAIDQFVGAGEGVELDQLDADRLRAVGWLSRWLDLPHLPSQAAIDRALGLAALLEPLRALADDKFVGREDLLARLDDHLREPGAPLLIHGMGGAGKSAVLARHILRHVPETLVCYLNFDNSALDPAVPASLIVGLLRQLAAQLPGAETTANTALLRAVEALRAGTKLLDSSSRTLSHRFREDVQLAQLADITRKRPTLFIFDTVEEVQRRSIAVQETFADFVNDLASTSPHASILLAGRSPAPELGFESAELSVLPPADAITLLHALVEVPEAEARRVVGLIRTTPLCVRLAAGILRRHPANDAFRDLALRRTAIEGELYHRLLGYIDDPDVRRLAHPGLTLRRVTPELIEEVLAIPCGIAVHHEEHAYRLFHGLAREAMLVERVPHRDEVVHRADVRSIMLPRLAEDDPRTTASIHRRAVKYYASCEGVAERAEELYHRLMLGQTPATLNRRWDDQALPHLLSSLDEMPPSSKAYLAARSPDLAVSADDLRQAQLDVRSKLILRNVRDFAANLRFDQALSTLDEHDRVVGPTLESTDLRINVLDLLGLHGEALDVAATAQEKAARNGDTDDYFRLTAHILRLCELTGRLEDANTVAAEALQIAGNLPPTVSHLRTRLQLVVQRLRFARHGAPVDDDTVGDLREQAILLHNLLGVRSVQQVPGLLRELAAEVGEHSLAVLVEALRSEGIDPRDADQVRAQFAQDPRVTNALRQAMSSTDDRYALAKMVVLVLSFEGEPPEGTTRLLTELLQQEADDAVAGGTDSEYTKSLVGLPELRVPVTSGELAVASRFPAATKDFELAEELLRSVLNLDLGANARAQALLALENVAPTEAESRRARLKAAATFTVATEAFWELDHARDAAMSGDMESTVGYYNNAIAIVERERAAAELDSVALELVLTVRGLALIALGKLDRAEQDFGRVLELAGDEHPGNSAAASRYLGQLAILRADLPTAIAYYRDAEDRLGQAEAMLSAGLAVDAANLLKQHMHILRAARAGRTLAITEHRAATAAYLRGDFRDASELARSANRRFTRRGEYRWAAISALTRMRAQVATGKPPTVGRIAELAKRLRQFDLTDEAAVAEALSVRVRVRRGDLESAMEQVHALPDVGHLSPIECRMALRLCRAELVAARGDHQGVLVEAQQGLAELANHPDRLGTLDLPTGTAVEGRTLANLAVEVAWRSGDPDLFDWLEHAKADIYRYDPRPAPEVVSELRITARRRQQARFEGRPAEDVDAELSRRLRDLPAVHPVCSREEVAAALGERALVSFGIAGDRYIAMILTATHTVTVEIGTTEVISTAARKLHMDVRAMAPDYLPAPLVQVIGTSSSRLAEQLDASLIEPLGRYIGGRDLVVVPARELHDVPWGLLPSLRGRATTVVRSASEWLRAERTEHPAGHAVVVRTTAGTDGQTARDLRNAVQLSGEQATVAAVLSALDGAGLAHLSVHLVDGTGNPWFSAAELVDGLLVPSTIRLLSRPPSVVVIDTCERVEAFGFAGALIDAGVRAVVTPVSKVGDAACAATLADFYRHLGSGETIARALAFAIAKDPQRRPFICLGADGTVDLS